MVSFLSKLALSEKRVPFKKAKQPVIPDEELRVLYHEENINIEFQNYLSSPYRFKKKSLYFNYFSGFCASGSSCSKAGIKLKVNRRGGFSCIKMFLFFTAYV